MKNSLVSDFLVIIVENRQKDSPLLIIQPTDAYLQHSLACQHNCWEATLLRPPSISFSIDLEKLMRIWPNRKLCLQPIQLGSTCYLL